jgi:hypothetical protein
MATCCMSAKKSVGRAWSGSTGTQSQSNAMERRTNCGCRDFSRRGLTEDAPPATGRKTGREPMNNSKSKSLWNNRRTPGWMRPPGGRQTVRAPSLRRSFMGRGSFGHAGGRSGSVCVQRAGRARSADLQSAVSQVFNLPNVACEQRSADYKSAIRQIKNLRYGKQIPGS